MRRLVNGSSMKWTTLICVVVAAGVFQGCATSRLTGVWSDSEYAGGPIDSVVVVGISDRDARRRLFENDFSRALKQLGVKAATGESILPQGNKVSKEEATQIIRNSGFASAIVTRTVSIDTRTETIPARMEYTQGGSFSTEFPNRFNAVPVFVPPEEIKYTVVQVETSLYDLTTGKCLWSATSEAIDPKNVDTLIASIIKTVIKDMQAKKLLPV